MLNANIERAAKTVLIISLLFAIGCVSLYAYAQRRAYIAGLSTGFHTTTALREANGLAINTGDVNSVMNSNQNVASNGGAIEIEPLFPVSCKVKDGAGLPLAQKGWKYVGLTDACLYLPTPDLEPLHGWGTIPGNDPSVFGGKNYIVVFKANGSQRSSILTYILPLKVDDEVLPGSGKTLSEVRGSERNIGSKEVPVYTLSLLPAGFAQQDGDVAVKSKTRLYVLDDPAHQRVYLFRAFYEAPTFEKSDDALDIERMILGSRPY
ncbi:MAG: hypothetical protein RLZZ324_1180 [Candidatus Parcubacteria bacterium]|jgi:hypothetical protein